MKYLIILILLTSIAKAEGQLVKYTKPTKDSAHLSWRETYQNFLQQEKSDGQEGISVVISGSLALLGGIVGANVTQDPIEKGIYSIFQTIGVASIGYGTYKWKLGSDDRTFIKSLKMTEGLSDLQRESILMNYYSEKRRREQIENRIRALTHGLIAALNYYNGSKQNNESVKNTLYFIGTVNLLASFSFTF